MVFFTALVFMEAYFPLLEKGFLAKPVNVSLSWSDSAKPPDFEVKQVVYFGGIFISRNMAQTANNSWQTDKENWVKNIRIILPESDLKKLTGISVEIQNQKRVFYGKEIIKSWEKSKSGGMVILESPNDIKNFSSRISRSAGSY